ncbi:MAG: DNA-processing protein DprA [Gammaproteobacteria bacterium]|nr:DNA-processing protein DprA [Gammaproteobacteria bacterium]
MDKGLDITLWRRLFACHATLGAAGSRWRRGSAASASFGRPASGPEDALEHFQREVHGAGLCPDWAAADATLAWLAADPARRALVTGDVDYPPRLAAIAVPPALLFVAGDAACLSRPQLAIVGARKATAGAREAARDIAAAVALRGAVVTSGLALGADAAAHRGALAAGGSTVAVLAHGLDQVYPRAHAGLAREVRAQGALVSEFPLGCAPLRAHFPQRNRIIAGLALGVLVVEAAARSGSLSTAMHALEQGREVFAMPGSIHNPLSRGCHALIRDGARLTESIEDILDELPQLAVRAAAGQPAPGVSPRPLDGAARRLLETCGWAPFTIDDAVVRSGLTVQEVSSILLALELDGHVESQAGGIYTRAR